MRTPVLVWLWLFPCVVVAWEARVEVLRDQDHYQVTVDTRIRAPAERILAVLKDFDHLTRLHRTVVKSRILNRRDDQTRVYVRVRGCILFVCRTLTQTLDFKPDPQRNYMVADVDPAHSDFKYGRMQWELQAETSNVTQLRYQADLVPDFWIPPLIGPWAMKSQLHRMAVDMTEELEKLASES